MHRLNPILLLSREAIQFNSPFLRDYQNRLVLDLGIFSLDPAVA